MANLNRLGSGKRLIKEIISGRSQDNLPWSVKQQEEKLRSLKKNYSSKVRPTK